MLEAVLFDADGTLINLFARQEAWFRHWTEQNNTVWPFSSTAQFRTFYNQCINREGGVQNVYNELKLPCDMKDRKHPVWPAYEAFSQKNPSFLYQGVKETVEELWKLGQLGKDISRNRRLRLGINTTNSWR